MQLIIIAGLGLLAVFLVVIIVFFLLIARNLKTIAAAVEHASSLAQAAGQTGGPPLTGPPTKRSMKEIFSVLPGLLKRADHLRPKG